MSVEDQDPKHVRHARLFELLRQESIAEQRTGVTTTAPPPPQQPQMSEQELLARALGSLNPRG